MSNIFIIHGALGNPEENWFPWLKKELEKLGHKVFVPAFPTPENQTLASWLKVFEPYSNYLNAKSIVIGHSLGPPFLLRLLEDHRVKSFYSIAGFANSPGNQFDESMLTFTQHNFKWRKILENCQHFHVLHGDNDPYVPLAKANELAEKLHTKVHLVPNAGHFNSAAGYNTFPLLLEEINKELEPDI